MSVVIQCLVFTHVFLCLFQCVTSRYTTVPYLNTTSDMTPTPPTHTNEMEIMTSSFEVAHNGSHNISATTEDKFTVSQTNVTSLPVQSAHNVSDIETSSSVQMGLDDPNINETSIAEYYDDYKLNISKNSTDPSPPPHISAINLVTDAKANPTEVDSSNPTTLYGINDTMSYLASTTELTITTETASSNNSEAGIISSTTAAGRPTKTESVGLMDTTTVSLVVDEDVTTGNPKTRPTTENIGVTDDGLQFDDVYLPLAVSLISILMWLLLSFFIYIIACNRVTSRRTAYSVSSRGAYSNKAFVAGVVATDDRCYNDDGIEILRTAL